jgi:hypothetical protein
MLESARAIGFQELENDLGKLVGWLLNAFCNTPTVEEAIAAHGDVSYSTGPTPFLKQCGIIVNLGRPRKLESTAYRAPRDFASLVPRTA